METPLSCLQSSNSSTPVFSGGPQGGPLKGKGKPMVLVVDDNPLVLNVTAKIVERVGYQAITAGDGEAALYLFKRHQEALCAVILDIMMPGLDGKETFRRMEGINPAVPVILTSGYFSGQTDADPLPLGIAAFMPKPFTPATVESLLKNLARPLDKE